MGMLIQAQMAIKAPKRLASTIFLTLIIEIPPKQSNTVIANQCAHWCGDPPDIPETLGDCHVGAKHCPSSQ